ncbi:MAG: hypothetical protein HC908_08555 [Calothrix sp. SM1_7_51]|nr:hypothetical protein [Calothrix sp. SM1_7_51]
MSYEYNEIYLELTNSEPDWIDSQGKNILLIEPGKSKETTFRCKPPLEPITPSGKYSFTISAESRISRHQTSESGNIEIIPQGIVQFDCQKTHKTIPSKK